jgi:putative ABC transport system permease protein
MKEIAIRKALGAETGMLLKELSKQFLIVVSGFIALFSVYYLLNKWLENFAFQILFRFCHSLLVFFVLMLLTLIVVLSKAYQATKMDIWKHLKYE